ncbi:hypothetical protein H4R20_003243 [Coemansia guatemalensis]|uniref:GH18 domain-containing protein n=1 Tax=Coemansia guatemalensis TaxID=2761395 RepID=A0A9W8HU07_9FUNG|nr:hypothetical protein H4R20_003243 [Coemansia guatemalensis]
MPRARKVGYYTAWSIYDRGFVPADVAVERLTHINYGFAKLEGNTVALGDPWADVEKPHPNTTYGEGDLKGNIGEFNNERSPVRLRNPQLRTLISVGGWTWSAGFSPMASSAHSRAEFVRSVGDFLQRYHFDGIDIDWEHPVEGGMDGIPHSPDDARNYLRLLRELRQYLDHECPRPRFGRYEISIATSAAPSVYRHLDLGAIAQVVDHINIMAYDYAGSWSPTAGHHQNLFKPAVGDQGINGHDSVSDYIRRGAPPHKLVLGVGFYGRGFSNVDARRSAIPTLPGLGCSFSGVPKGTWEPGSFDYKDLRVNYMSPGSNYTIHWDDTAKAPLLFNPHERVLISFDDAVAVSWKADYVLRRGLGGIMIWELSQDYQHELLTKICDYLG